MFSIALLLFCFSISNPSTRIFVAVTSVMVAALIGWCIRNAWESSEDRWLWIDRILPHITRAMDYVHGVRNDIFTFILRCVSPTSLPYGHHSGSLQAIHDRERGGV